jgi:hypothetical protein
LVGWWTARTTPGLAASRASAIAGVASRDPSSTAMISKRVGEGRQRLQRLADEASRLASSLCAGKK